MTKPLFCSGGLFILLLLVRFSPADSPKKLDPAAWGSDHVGKPVPEYITGDECLFCHRTDVGPTWRNNRHQLTIRELDRDHPALTALKQSPESKQFAEEAKLVLGNENRQRFLKPAEAYGKLDLLSMEWTPPKGEEKGRLVSTEKPHWNQHKFADNCAGCHATGVDSKARTFSAPSVDCYACHGHVTLDHTKDSSLMWLAKKRKDPARVVTSICAQCHVRTGKSRSTGLPYANNFVAGDNLFRDFQVDFSEDKIGRLNPADRHILENVRDVVLYGKEEMTCLSCHDVHKQSSKKHRVLSNSAYCANCHNATGPKKIVKRYEVHSAPCEY